MKCPVFRLGQQQVLHIPKLLAGYQRDQHLFLGFALLMDTQLRLALDLRHWKKIGIFKEQKQLSISPAEKINCTRFFLDWKNVHEFPNFKLLAGSDKKIYKWELKTSEPGCTKPHRGTKIIRYPVWRTREGLVLEIPLFLLHCQSNTRKTNEREKKQEIGNRVKQKQAKHK